MDLVIQYITYPLYSVVKEQALPNPFGLVGDWKLEASATALYFLVSSLSFATLSFFQLEPTGLEPATPSLQS